MEDEETGAMAGIAVLISFCMSHAMHDAREKAGYFFHRQRHSAILEICRIGNPGCSGFVSEGEPRDGDTEVAGRNEAKHSMYGNQCS